ncbi:MAG: hypothetical protein J6R10_01495 [Tidjanibacter sp.]|nr:hypothetical protein [Tidjanibacter sp.]
MKTNYNRNLWLRWGVPALYLVLCGLYFSPIATPYKLTYPLLWLTCASLFCRRPIFTLALIFSALGDWFGATGGLIWQIGAFALAQLCYLLLLLHRREGRVTLWRVVAAALVPMALMVATICRFVPAIDEGVVKVGVVVYALLIGSMATVALLSKSWLIGGGAVLFMLSDFLLAQQIFVTSNPLLLNVSLALYFAGQLLLWVGLYIGEKRR